MEPDLYFFIMTVVTKLMFRSMYQIKTEDDLKLIINQHKIKWMHFITLLVIKAQKCHGEL